MELDLTVVMIVNVGRADDVEKARLLQEQLENLIGYNEGPSWFVLIQSIWSSSSCLVETKHLRLYALENNKSLSFLTKNIPVSYIDPYFRETLFTHHLSNAPKDMFLIIIRSVAFQLMWYKPLEGAYLYALVSWGLYRYSGARHIRKRKRPQKWRGLIFGLLLLNRVPSSRSSWIWIIII